jgi:hypothetical protein
VVAPQLADWKAAIVAAREWAIDHCTWPIDAGAGTSRRVGRRDPFGRP